MNQGLLLLYGMVWLFLAGQWIRRYGWWRGVGASFCRLGWTLPFLTLLFPLEREVPLPPTAQGNRIYLLLDDSDSMKTHKKKMDSWVTQVQNTCRERGCEPLLYRLSQVRPDTLQGVSPLYRGWKEWKQEIPPGEPWLFFSDGGESFDSIANLAPFLGAKSPGGVVNVGEKNGSRIWIHSVESSEFAFDGQPLSLSFQIKNTKVSPSSHPIQVQLSEMGKVIRSQSLTVLDVENPQDFTMELPALSKGHHLLSLHILPRKGDVISRDQEKSFSVEVLANSVGVLHLLGAPSWDGRFLRRYFSSEPKLDVISFFILRDPWDTQGGQEKNLSLIQFPVETLFTTELHAFRLIVMQNFSFSQFLEPEYQENLVRFVEEGGSLLFIGGPRALTELDLRNSPLRKILPFDTSAFLSAMASLPQNVGAIKGSNFDETQAFSIQSATPTLEERSFATLYEDWVQKEPFLSRWKSGKGVYQLETSWLRRGAVTPLAFARLPSGKQVPLAVASYPGKGRALWIFSDHLWNLALGENQSIPRNLYQDLMDKNMQWLLRQELVPPLAFTEVSVERESQNALRWHVALYGAAGRNFYPQGSWKLEVCGLPQPLDQVKIHRASGLDFEIDGWLMMENPIRNAQCGVRISGVHPSFGSLKIEKFVPILTPEPDVLVKDNPDFLRQLAEKVQAQFWDATETSPASLEPWLVKHGTRDDVVPMAQSKHVADPYWFFQLGWGWWIWILLFAVGEVLLRRYREIFG